MSMTDPIADMLTRIRNGQQVRRATVEVPASKLKKAILTVLTDEGYISGFTLVEGAKHPTLDVELKYVGTQGVITEITRVSKPGLRVYSAAAGIPKVRNGLGIAVVTTSQGVMSDAKAREMKLGGEVICNVF